jgi:hypothetical protein
VRTPLPPPSQKIKPVRCELCQTTLTEQAGYDAHFASRKHRKRAADPPDVDPEVMGKVVRNLRLCLKFLAPPNWSIAPDEIAAMDAASLSHFPLDQFLDHYKAQMEEFITTQEVSVARSLSLPSVDGPHRCPRDSRSPTPRWLCV